MESIKDKVAIIGMGCTKFGENWQWSAEDMVIEATYQACNDAGVEPKDIQAAWLGSYHTGRQGKLVGIPLKLENIPITRVENACASGSDAFRNACYAVIAGVYDIVLAVGVEKLKDAGYSGLGGQPEKLGDSEVEFGTPPAAVFSLAATRYCYHYGLSLDEMKRTLANIAVKNHYNGSLNPRAHFRNRITVEKAINAPMIAWPLGLFDCCGVSDGAAAAIITRADLAKNYRDNYVLVKALSIVCGSGAATVRNDYDYVHFDENVAAAKSAYQEAGIKDPRKEIHIAEVHDCFTINELITMEDLGFSPRGKAKEDIDSGFFNLDGGLPVNTDGGLKCFGHPIGATGLRMLYEVYTQLQGKASERQVKNASIGLTHNLGGYWVGGQTSAIIILGQRN